MFNAEDAQKLVDELVARWNAKNPESFAALFRDDAVFIDVVGNTMLGPKQIGEGHARPCQRSSPTPCSPRTPSRCARSPLMSAPRRCAGSRQGTARRQAMSCPLAAASCWSSWVLDPRASRSCRSATPTTPRPTEGVTTAPVHLPTPTEGLHAGPLCVTKPRRRPATSRLAG